MLLMDPQGLTSMKTGFSDAIDSAKASGLGRFQPKKSHKIVWKTPNELLQDPTKINLSASGICAFRLRDLMLTYPSCAPGVHVKQLKQLHHCQGTWWSINPMIRFLRSGASRKEGTICLSSL